MRSWVQWRGMWGRKVRVSKGERERGEGEVRGGGERGRREGKGRGGGEGGVGWGGRTAHRLDCLPPPPAALVLLTLVLVLVFVFVLVLVHLVFVLVHLVFDVILRQPWAATDGRQQMGIRVGRVGTRRRCVRVGMWALWARV